MNLLLCLYLYAIIIGFWVADVINGQWITHTLDNYEEITAVSLIWRQVNEAQGGDSESVDNNSMAQ